MANDKLISVIVPTYNQAHYLPICLDHIWFQDYPNLEIIVINAASPDRTKEALVEYQESVAKDQVSFAKYFNEATGEVERQYHDRFPKEGRQLRIFNLEKDPGLSETYNAGLREARGDYVTTIVSDDFPHPGMISKLARELDAGYDFAYADLLIVDDQNRVIRRFCYPDYDPQACLADWYLMGSGKLWKRELHDKVGYCSSEYPMTQDYELFFRFAEAGGKFVHVNEVLYSVRWHGPQRKTGNHTGEREPKIFTESKQIALRARNWLAEKNKQGSS